MALKRKQIYLDRESDRRIKRLARKTHLPQAEHIRRAVADYVRKADPTGPAKERDPLLALVGICKKPGGPRDGALHHDRDLYGRRSS
jgi:hypothetical protein